MKTKVAMIASADVAVSAVIAFNVPMSTVPSLLTGMVIGFAGCAAGWAWGVRW